MQGARNFSGRRALVGRALGHPDDVDSTVVLGAGLSGAGASGDPRSVDALFAEIFHGVGGAIARDLIGFLRLLGIGITDDDGCGARLILQPQGHVIEDAIQTLSMRALSGRPNAQSLILLACGGVARPYLDHRRAIRGAASAVVDAHRHRVIARREARRVEVHCRAAADDPAGIGAPGVGERIAVGIAGIRCDMNRSPAKTDGRSAEQAMVGRFGLGTTLHRNAGTCGAAAPSSTFAVMVHNHRHAGREPTNLGTRPVHLPAGGRPRPSQRIVVRIRCGAVIVTISFEPKYTMSLSSMQETVGGWFTGGGFSGQ